MAEQYPIVWIHDGYSIKDLEKMIVHVQSPIYFMEVSTVYFLQKF